MPESKSTKGPAPQGKQEQRRRSARNEQKKLNLAVQQSDRDPQLAHTDPGTDSRHHAISDVPSQLQSEETGPLTGSKSAKGNDKKPKITAAARLSTGTRCKAIASPKDDPPAATASKRRSNNQHVSHDTDDKSAKIQHQSNPSNNGTKLQRLKLNMPSKGKPRTQRSSYQKYTLHLTTEVDWNEDLHPTDDDEALAINDKGGDVGLRVGTSVSTPDPELTSDGEHEIKTNQKRKVSKTQTTSEKRRKVSSTKSSSGSKNQRQPQLPLTAVSASKSSKPSSSKLRSNARSSNGHLTSAHTRTTLTGPPSGHSALNLKDTASQQKEIIVISSSPAPPSSSISDTGIDVLQNETYRYRVMETGTTGRGKAVGQKLRDALQGVELHTQLRPALETSLQSTDKGLDGISNEKATSPSSRMHSTTGSQDENSHAHLTIQQNQEDVMMIEAQPEPEPLPLHDTDTEPQRESIHQDRPDDEKMVEYPSRLREESSSPEASIHRDYSTDETHDESETNSPTAVSPGVFNTTDAPEHFHASIASSQSPIDYESDTSSQYPSNAEVTGFANGQLRNGRNNDNQTPDSQQPLLTRQPVLQRPSGASGPVIMALRSSIIDENGSPRLFEDASLALNQIKSPLKEVQIPSDLETPQSSPIPYDQISDECSLHRWDDEAWSRYQRQIGLARESMNKRPQSALPRDSVGEEGGEMTTSRRMPRQSDPALSYNPLVGTSIATGPDTDRTRADQNSATVINSNRGDNAQSSLHAGPNEVVPRSTQAQEVSRVQQSSQSDQIHPPDWILALQTAQKNAHDLLQETNQVSPADPSPIDYHAHELIFGQSLSSQLAAEQEMIQQVLQIYRQGCNRILDDLSQAHQARMNLYQQQMTSVRDQHHAICQDLIRGFQALDDRVQEGP